MTSEKALYVGNLDGDPRLVVQDNGNVGIGTGNPQARLEVAGPIRLGDSGAFTPTDGMIRYNLTTGAFEAFTGGTWRVFATPPSLITVTNVVYHSANITNTCPDFLGCNNKEECTFNFNYGTSGCPGYDPAYGVPKALSYSWNCSGGGSHSLTNPPEAAGSIVSMTCP